MLNKIQIAATFTKYISVSLHREASKLYYKYASSAEPLDESLGYFPDDYSDLYYAINQLVPRDRQLIYLKYWFGYSDREIAVYFRVSRQYISARRLTVLDILRDYLA